MQQYVHLIEGGSSRHHEGPNNAKSHESYSDLLQAVLHRYSQCEDEYYAAAYQGSNERSLIISPALVLPLAQRKISQHLHEPMIRPHWSGPPGNEAHGAEEDGSDVEEAQA